MHIYKLFGYEFAAKRKIRRDNEGSKEDDRMNDIL